MYRSEKYLNFIRSHPCLMCGKPSRATHQRFLGGGGTSLKPPDSHCLPLCDECHKRQEADSVKFWCEYWLSEVPEAGAKEMAQLIVYRLITGFLTEYLEGHGT